MFNPQLTLRYRMTVDDVLDDMEGRAGDGLKRFIACAQKQAQQEKFFLHTMMSSRGDFYLYSTSKDLQAMRSLQGRGSLPCTRWMERLYWAYIVAVDRLSANVFGVMLPKLIEISLRERDVMTAEECWSMAVRDAWR